MQFCNKCKSTLEDAGQTVNNTTDTLSKFFVDRYNEAFDLKNKREKKKKRKKMSGFKNTLLGASLGFTAGAAASYFLIKKYQIKDSDYVFNDQNAAVENINYQEPQMAPAPVQGQDPFAMNQVPVAATPKNYRELNNNYQISDDGSTLIKKKI